MEAFEQFMKQGEKGEAFIRLYRIASELLELPYLTPEDLIEVARAAIVLASLYSPEEFLKTLSASIEDQKKRGNEQ